MGNRIRHVLRGSELPGFLVPILISGRCQGFLPMTIVREESVCVLTYDASYYERVEFENMDAEEKLRIAAEIIRICSDCEDLLIRPELFILNRSLVYRRVGDCPKPRVKLCYLPDRTLTPRGSKLAAFIASIIDEGDASEAELFGRLLSDLRKGEIWRAERRLSRMLERLDCE